MKIKDKLQDMGYLIFNFITDFIYLLNLLLEIKVNKKNGYDEYYIKELKVLLQFLGRSYDKSAFEYHNLNNEDYLFSYYYSLKNKNSTFFKVFCLVHSFMIEYLFIQTLFILNKKFYHKFMNLYESYYNKVILQKIKNNFGYEYLREYKKYWSDDKEYYNKIKYKVFFEETLINLCNSWNKFIKRFKINTDTLFFDIEKHF